MVLKVPTGICVKVKHFHHYEFTKEIKIWSCLHSISKHLNNIFESDELNENAVGSKMATTVFENKSYLTTYYKLDANITARYIVKIPYKQLNSVLRQRKTVREFIFKCYILNDEILKNSKLFGENHFNKLIEHN